MCQMVGSASPTLEGVAVEDLGEAGVFVWIVGSGVVKPGHAGEFFAVGAGGGWAVGRGFERRWGRTGLAGLR